MGLQISEEITMFKKTVLIGLLASIIAAPALADNASKKEGAGIGLGAVIGGVIGGPPGVILGAAFGARISDEFRQRNTKVDSLSASLGGSESQVDSLKKNVRSLNGEIESINAELLQARAMAKPEILALLEAGIEMDLLFRTDEYVLADSTGTRLSQLAATVSGNPEIQIRLDGFADERGDETYNQELSVRRAEHVRDVLVSNGIPASRITVNAHGESPAPDATVDSFALERRVSLTLYMGDTPSFASNPR
jgi:outer membrane protein OmpA-like peptidoglycan-associated protein